MDFITQLFPALRYGFMQNALLAVVMIAPVMGLLGTMAVNSRMAFFSDALGHSALTGIALGVALGIDQPVICMLAFGLFLAMVITRIKNANTQSADTIIAVCSAGAMALGLAILSRGGGFAKYSQILVGDILSVSPSDLLSLLVVLVAVVGLWLYLSNALMLISVNRPLAASRGIPAAVYEYVFVGVVAVAVMLAIQWIGILLINALLILPAAAARNIARNMRQYHLLSVGIALVCCVGGLFLAFEMDIAAGAAIVMLCALAFAVTYLVRGRLGGR